MAYTIELSRQEEDIVQRRAARLGITAEEYVRRTVGRGLRSGRFSPLTLTDDEQQALTQLNARLPSTFWERYAELSTKLRARTLSDAEHEEIMQLAAREEAWNGERLLLLQKMAASRQASLLDLMRHNGIGHHPDADRFLPR